MLYLQIYVIILHFIKKTTFSNNWKNGREFNVHNGLLRVVRLNK